MDSEMLSPDNHGWMLENTNGEDVLKIDLKMGQPAPQSVGPTNLRILLYVYTDIDTTDFKLIAKIS